MRGADLDSNFENIETESKNTETKLAESESHLRDTQRQAAGLLMYGYGSTDRNSLDLSDNEQL